VAEKKWRLGDGDRETWRIASTWIAVGSMVKASSFGWPGR
jgi:hypothetical protein